MSYHWDHLLYSPRNFAGEVTLSYEVRYIRMERVQARSNVMWFNFPTSSFSHHITFQGKQSRRRLQRYASDGRQKNM